MQQNTRSLAVWQTTALYIAIYGVMAAVVLYPVLSVKIPVLCDYLNHLARMHILADIGHSAALSSFYRVQWKPIPYLAMDVAFLPLRHIPNIYTAGRIFVAICVLLPVPSVAILHFVVHRRFSLIPAVTFLFCYNYLLSYGLLPYLFTLSLAIMVLACWIGSVGWPRWPRAALFCVLALALYLCHLVAFGAYCLAVAGFEFARAWRAGFRPWRAFAADWLAAGLQAVLPMTLALTVKLEHPFAGPVVTFYGDLGAKIIALRSPIWFFGGRADDLPGDFALLVLILGLLTRRLRLAPAIWPIVLLIGAVAVCTPDMLFSVYGMDWRLPLLVVLLIIGGLSTTERMNHALAAAVLGGFLLMTVVRAATIASALSVLDRQVAEVRHVLGEMPHGMRLLMVDNLGGKQSVLPSRATQHLGLLAVIDRDAFVPTLFTGTTIVSPAPELLRSSTPAGLPPSVSELMVSLDHSGTSSGPQFDDAGHYIYWSRWEDMFDYILIRHLGNRAEVSLPYLRLVATSSIADLYRIDKSFKPDLRAKGP
jgi:hypothetical protein